MGWAVRRRFVALSLGLLLSPGAQAQDSPPPALPGGTVAFPPLAARALGFGSDLIVVERRAVPFVTVIVAVRGVSATNAEAPGEAALVARMLMTGTTTRSAEELAGAVDFLGVTLRASAGPDWSTVTLGVARENLDGALEILADVVMRPSFRPEALGPLLGEVRAGVEAGLMHPATVATRTLLREVYGEHRYARGAGEERVASLDSVSLRAYHDANYVPWNATFVVAGDVHADDVVGRLEEHFGDWAGDGGPATPSIAVPERTLNDVILVHLPGAARATIRVGHALMAGDHPDWTALTVANHVLHERLVRASSAVNRRIEAGHYVAGAETRPEGAGSAVELILDEMERLGSEEVPPGELSEIKGFLAGAFALQVETPQQIARQVVSARLFGPSADGLGRYREAVLSLDPTTVREVTSQHLKPHQAVVVVVGDASVLRAPLTRFGPVSVVDVEGLPLDLADLVAEPPALDLDASGLADGSWVYGVTIDGERVGEMVRTFAHSGPEGSDSVTLTSTMVIGSQTLRQEVTFRAASFAPLAGSFSLTAPGGEIGAGASVDDGRVHGSRTFPDGRVEEFQVADTPGAVMGEMLEVALWLSDLSHGRELEIPVIQVESGTVTTMRAKVLDVGPIDVPAGRFEAYRIEMNSEAGLQILHARVEAPHIVLRLETRGQPLVLELEFVSGS